MFYAVTTEQKIGALNRSVVVVAKNAQREFPSGITGYVENALSSWATELYDLDYSGWVTDQHEVTNFNSADTGKETLSLITQNADVRVMITVKSGDYSDKIVQFTVKNVTKSNISTKIAQEFNRLTNQSMPNANIYCTNAIIKLK